MIRLTGTLTCGDEAMAAIVRRLLPAHVGATRNEPGCLSFSVIETSPLVWRVDEAFVDRAAYEAHQARAAASEWSKATVQLVRNYKLTED
jgi:quinol monooxygenase YgiN